LERNLLYGDWAYAPYTSVLVKGEDLYEPFKRLLLVNIRRKSHVVAFLLIILE
jgi:hypothetical protein